MVNYYLIRVDGKIVYACTDPRRFIREAAKVSSVANATLELPQGA